VIRLDLQIDVARKSAVACQIEVRSNQRRSQRRGDDAAFAGESFADFGSDAIGVRASLRKPLRQGSDHVAVARQSCDLVSNDLGLGYRVRGCSPFTY